MFASVFSSAFAGRSEPAGCICPMTAQAALADGAGWSVEGSAVRVGGALLIGQAGKVFSFASAESAGKWVENARNIGVRERSLMLQIDPAAAALWKSRKRAKLAIIAGHVVNAAARVGDADKRAALLAEADLCLAKWVD